MTSGVRIRSSSTAKLPKQSDMRYNWVVVRLAAIDVTEMREIVIDAWRMVVPKFLAEAQARGDF